MAKINFINIKDYLEKYAVYQGNLALALSYYNTTPKNGQIREQVARRDSRRISECRQDIINHWEEYKTLEEFKELGNKVKAKLEKILQDKKD